MKKTAILLILLVLVGVKVFAEEKPSYFYGSLSTLGGIGGGYRYQQGVHGFDIAGNMLPFIEFNVLHGKALYLFHPTGKGFYLGGGLGIGALYTRRNGFDSVTLYEAALGYEWKKANGTRIFLEANAITPFPSFHDKKLSPDVWPGITFGIGF